MNSADAILGTDNAENQQNTDELANPSLTCADCIIGTSKAICQVHCPHRRFVTVWGSESGICQLADCLG